jgi:mono/diheme cytochrome c family protein
MLKTNCLGCHGPTKQNAGVRVDTYASVSASLQDIDPDIENGFMPPTGPLSAADMQLFQAWVDQGALNN